MWLEAEKARNFNAVVWVLGEVNGYHYVDLFFNLLSDKSTDRRADITHSVMAVLRKDFIGFTRLPCTSPPIDRLDGMAGAYADAVTAAGLPGPFVPVGYSYGAALAGELSAELAGRGHAVPFVAVIDALPDPQAWVDGVVPEDEA